MYWEQLSWLTCGGVKARYRFTRSGKRGLPWEMCVTCELPRESCAGFQTWLCSWYESAQPIAPIGSGVLLPGGSFCGLLWVQREWPKQNILNFGPALAMSLEDILWKLNQFKKLHNNVLLKFLAFVSVLFLLLRLLASRVPILYILNLCCLKCYWRNKSS